MKNNKMTSNFHFMFSFCGGWGEGQERGRREEVRLFDGTAAVNDCDRSESDVLSRGVEILVFSE